MAAAAIDRPNVSLDPKVREEELIALGLNEQTLHARQHEEKQAKTIQLDEQQKHILEASTELKKTLGACVAASGRTQVHLLKKLYGLNRAYPHTVEFKYWHYESLLAQGAELLERCMAERAAFFELKSELIALAYDTDLQTAQIQLALSSRTDGALFGDQQIAHTEAAIRIGAVIKNEYGRIKSLAHQLSHGNPTEQHHAWASSALIDETLNMMMAEMARVRATALESESEHIRLFSERATAVLSARTVHVQGLQIETRLEKLADRIVCDFGHAIERLIVANRGLTELLKFPDILAIANLTENDGWKLIDEVVDWNRWAIQRLAATIQNEQGFIRTFSFRRLMKDKFQEALKAVNAEGIATFNFTLTRKDLPEHLFLRLRGVSIFTAGSNDPGEIFTATVKIPGEGLQYFTPNVAEQVSQQDFTPVHLGRIGSRMVPASPELAGTLSILNASPLSAEGSTWTVQLQSLSHASHAINELRDIQIELHLCGLTYPGGQR